MSTEIVFAPLVAPWIIGLLVVAGGALCLARVGLGGRRALVPTFLRLVSIVLLAGVLANPETRQTEGDVQPDIALVLEDQSRSLEFGDRVAIAEGVTAQLVRDLEAEGVEVRRTPFGDRTQSDLAAALKTGLADVPRRRLSAVFAITDGQIHGDLPAQAGAIGAPIHTLLTGDMGREIDRRVEIVRAPRFGVVGENVELTLRVVSPTETGNVPVRLLVGGELYAAQEIPLGEDVVLGVNLRQPGETIVEMVAETAPGELTALNNRGVAALTAVRDRLRVLLVSGEPHAGERVWRNILKSDPAVDLVHFTILKPMTKTMQAAREDLNLIEFPHEELFLEKLPSFDVLIFDRYTYRNVLQSYEFEEIARYVENGGALLVAAGPEFAQRGSLADQRNLAYVLPILPNGRADEAPFVPARSTIGDRHPITAGLENPTDWGRWLRYLPGQLRAGHALLTAADEAPLLVVDRVDQGRIAVLMSDHVWLWARDFDGGGPHQEMLRRLVHWLMQEPALEEEALRGTVSAQGQLQIARQTLAGAVDKVTVTDPDGTRTDLTLSQSAPGLYNGELPAPLPGLYRLETQTEGGDLLYALAASGEGAIAELGAVQTSRGLMDPVAEATGGGIFVVRRPGDALPDLRRVNPNRTLAGRNWAGLPRRDIQAVQAVRIRPVAPALLWLAAIGSLIIAAWLLEGRRLKLTS